MKTFFAFMVLAFLPMFSPLNAQQKDHWLVGRWTGILEGFSGKLPANRMLRVHDVTPDGTAVSLWGIPPEDRVRVEAKVEGSQLKIFVPTSKSTIELIREGDSELIGKLVAANGRDWPIRLRKSKFTSRFDGIYSGTSRGSSGCGAIDYQVTVKESLIRGHSRWRASSWRANSAASSDSDVTGEVNDDGVVLIEVRGPARNSRFSGIIDDSSLTAMEPADRYLQCSFALKIMRAE